MTRFSEHARTLADRWKLFAESTTGRVVRRTTRWTFTLAIIALLVYQFSTIGLGEVARALPSVPWFYVLFLGLFFTLPVAESIAYGAIWKTPAWRLLGVTLKKRALNKDVAGYSGEVYLYLWAKEHVGETRRTLLHQIKDNSIVSSIVSTIVAFALLAGFYTSGLLPLELVTPNLPTFVAISIVAGILIAALTVKFRRSIFRLAARTLAFLAGVHFVRIILVQALQVLQWSIIVPEAPLGAWFSFLSIQIIASRIPLLPSRDLLTMSAILEICEPLGLPLPVVASMLLVNSVLDKGLNAIMFAVVSGTQWRRRTYASAGEPATLEDALGPGN